jgi:periplasmic divalent cation tolerance protein
MVGLITNQRSGAFSMDKEYIIVLITTPSKEVGEKIANTLLDKKLAACVNMMAPILSLYTWEEKINCDDEVLLIVKSRADLFESDLIPVVLAEHPYDVPEIIALPILMGSASYLVWIDDVTRQN